MTLLRESTAISPAVLRPSLWEGSRWQSPTAVIDVFIEDGSGGVPDRIEYNLVLPDGRIFFIRLLDVTGNTFSSDSLPDKLQLTQAQFAALGERTAELLEGGADPPTLVLSLNYYAAGPTSGILVFFDESVAAGNLLGSGPGNSANHRRTALRNMIEAAANLMAAGLNADAINQLQQALERTDGVDPPPDFVTGPAASELADLIEELMASIGP